MTVKELNLKIDALDEYSTLLYNMCDENKPLKYPIVTCEANKLFMSVM